MRRKRTIATTPNRGPNARIGKAHCQDQMSANQGTPRMVTRVKRNPRAVCNVSAVPRTSSAEVSVTMAENCAESATTLKPQTRNTGRTRITDLPNTNGVIRAHAPDIAIDPPATNARPCRSAQIPANQAPAPPTAMTVKVTTGTGP